MEPSDLNMSADSGSAMSSAYAVEWTRYWSTHHGHMTRSNRKLRELEFAANFAKWLPPPPARVLEIGFGNGESLYRLAARGYQDLHGWDISEECRARARAGDAGHAPPL